MYKNDNRQVSPAVLSSKKKSFYLSGQQFTPYPSKSM